MADNDAASEDRQLTYQMYMNGAHNGDDMIRSGFEWWMRRTLADLEQWAAIHAVLLEARQIEQRSGPSNAAQHISQVLYGLVDDRSRRAGRWPAVSALDGTSTRRRSRDHQQVVVQSSPAIIGERVSGLRVIDE
jgi:hypothetical protein